MKKTLGGDRLGSGKKLQVDLKTYNRSTHDLGYVWRSTMASGTLVPFMKLVGLNGDTFDINLQAVVKTLPTEGPLFGSYKVQLDLFVAPFRLYHSALHNNKIGIGLKMGQIKLPTVALTAAKVVEPLAEDTDIDNLQINPSCIMSYLGVRGVGWTADVQSGTTAVRNFNAIPLLAYWEIYKQYYANKQEEIGAVIHTPGEALIQTVTSLVRWNGTTATSIPQAPVIDSITFQVGHQLRILYTGTKPLPHQVILKTVEHGDILASEFTMGNWTEATGYIWATFNQARWGNVAVQHWKYVDDTLSTIDRPPGIATFPLENIDKMRDAILAHQIPNSSFAVGSPALEPYKWLTDGPPAVGVPVNIKSVMEGLALKTYQSDLFNNWLQTEWIDGVGGINDITSIDTTGGSFEINTFIMAKKVYEVLNQIAVSGGSYNDWQEAVWGEEVYGRCESPMYVGGLIKELVFQEVVSNSSVPAASTENSKSEPLGTLGGKGIMADKHKGGHVVVKIDEPSYLMGIVSLTPRVDYSQGNDWDTHLDNMDDLHKPGMDEIGFQELITEQMAWWDTEWTNSGQGWTQKSAGKQPAWINYMTAVNKTYGNFAMPNKEMYMTLNRKYERDPVTKSIKDLTTYIDPSKFNSIFAVEDLTAQNFWVQIAVDITARRKMSAKVMPNL